MQRIRPDRVRQDGEAPSTAHDEIKAPALETIGNARRPLDRLVATGLIAAMPGT